jgi:choline monooxygenase
MGHAPIPATAGQLPPSAYTDPDLLDLERRAIFTNSWVSVGVGAQVPTPGDVRPIDVAGQPLIITRAADASLHVFYNVCRHRGLQLVQVPCHRPNGLITCPYHTWSYGLDGSLKAAPYWDRTAGSAPPAKTQAELALMPVRFAVWFDTIYVNLSGDAPPFDKFIAPLATRWSGFDADEIRLLIAKDYSPAANWKLVCENFLDGYHVPWVHSQIGPPEAGADYQAVHLGEDIFGAFVPHGESERPRIDRPLPSFAGVAKEFRGSHHFIYVFPNTLLAIGEQWFQVISVLPETAQTSTEHLALYLVSDVAMQDDRTEQRDEFGRQMLLVNEQDLSVLERLQHGRASAAGEHCTYVPHWDELTAIFNTRMAESVSQ